MTPAERPSDFPPAPPPAADASSLLRRSLYGILIAVAAGNMTGRILAVNSVDKIALEKNLKDRGRADYQQQRPFLSANDRSRWCTVRSLVEHELKLIAELHYEPFFLTVYDLVREARARNILCQGRGSAANSAVCFCIGITAVDPSRQEVLFERFIPAGLGPIRLEFPDPTSVDWAALGLSLIAMLLLFRAHFGVIRTIAVMVALALGLHALGL